jgi:exosome complex component MTR3
MPGDSRRLAVPDDSKPPCVFARQREPPVQECWVDKSQNVRHDGRLFDQPRAIFANVGVVSQARGSAYMEVGQTKVICAVYGPREVKFRDEFSLLGQLGCDLKFATFSGKLRRQHQQDMGEKEASQIVKEALEPAVRLDKFPKARIDVFLMILEDDGSALSTAVSCASLALADGGVEMYDLVVGSTIRQFGGSIMVDPDSLEESVTTQKLDQSCNVGTVTVGFLPSLNQLSTVVHKGKLDVNTTKLAIKQCIEACQRVYPVLRQRLVSAINRRNKSH